MSTNNDYATGNLLNYLYNQRYKLTGIDLPRYANTRSPQQINFTGKLDDGDGTTKFFVSKKQQETSHNFSLDSLIVSE